MAALTHKTLLPILLISISLSLSVKAQNSFDDDQDGAAAPSGSYAVSYISSTPVASPAGAPVSTDSFDVSLLAVDIVDSGDDSSSSEEPSSGDSSSSSSGDDSSSSSTWGTMVLKDMQPISYDVPEAKKSSVNLFVQSTMQVSVAKTDNFIADVIEKRLQDPQIDSYSKECLETCKEVYEDSKSAMKKTLEDIHDSNYYKANVDIGAMSSDADSCKECVRQVFGQDQELDKFNKWVDGIIDQCLTMITGYRA